MRVQVMKDHAGILSYVPSEGTPAGDGTLSIYTEGTTLLDSDLEDVTTTLDVADEALTAAATAGSSTVAVADTSDFTRLERYVVTNEEGREQRVRLIGKTSTQLRFDEPLRFDCAQTTSTVKGIRLSYTLASPYTATKYRRLEALWTYTVDGRSYTRPTRFDIVERLFHLQIDEERIEGYASIYGESIGSRELNEKTFAAAERKIWSYLKTLRVHPDQIYDVEQLEEAACIYVLRLTDDDNAAKWKELYYETLREFRASEVWNDDDDDLAVDDLDEEEGANALARHLGLV